MFKSMNSYLLNFYRFLISRKIIEYNNNKKKIRMSSASFENSPISSVSYRVSPPMNKKEVASSAMDSPKNSMANTTNNALRHKSSNSDDSCGWIRYDSEEDESSLWSSGNKGASAGAKLYDNNNDNSGSNDGTSSPRIPRIKLIPDKKRKGRRGGEKNDDVSGGGGGGDREDEDDYISSEEDTYCKDVRKSIELSLNLKEEFRSGKLGALDKDALLKKTRHSFQSETSLKIRRPTEPFHDDLYFTENKVVGAGVKSKSDERIISATKQNKF